MNSVLHFLDYSKTTQKNLIEQKTIDEYKTTPVILASMGGHLEVVKELVSRGADLNARLENNRHGIVEIAAIRQDMDLLIYAHDKTSDLSKRIRDLMISERLDQSSRAGLGRTLEHLAENYQKTKLEQENMNLNEIPNLGLEQMISHQVIGHQDFGTCLANFFRLCLENENGFSSGVIILMNTIFDSTIRSSFLASKGIQYLMQTLERSRQFFQKRYELLNSKIKSTKTVDDFEVEDLFDREDEDKDLEDDDNGDVYLECASIGQVMSFITKYDDCLEIINHDGSNEKILHYIKLLFDVNNLTKIYQLKKYFDSEKQLSENKDSMKMKIFNIINMNNKNKKKKIGILKPIEVFLQVICF
jgi:hypothetical protein